MHFLLNPTCLIYIYIFLYSSPSSIVDIFTTIFWSLFGMVETDSVEIDEAYSISKVTNPFGYVLFGVYNVMAVIVFINILVAMLTSSFNHILV